MLDLAPALREARMLCIPSRLDVRAAAALIPRPEPVGLSRFGHQVTNETPRRYERPAFFLDIAPGLVRVRKRLVAEKFGYGDDDGVDDSEDDAPTRGRVTEWSERSRNRMTVTLESLDYEPMFSDPGRRAAMVTLTLPGVGDDGDPDYWESLVPDLPTFKKMVDRFVRAYAVTWGEHLRGVWKMEFQRRGAPHLHILMAPPARGERRSVRVRREGRGVTIPNQSFVKWAGYRWADIVGATGQARRDHEARGVDLSEREVERYADPRRIGTYFAKHGSFTAKDYQNDMPAHWRAKILAGESGGGNFWGYWGLEKAVETVELAPRRAGAARPAAVRAGELEPLRRRSPRGTERAWPWERPLCQYVNTLCASDAITASFATGTICARTIP
ncbi:hypothetical protein GCM10025881_40190 [Pseudolysinimonas kribbensis]|uniref:Replication-associated protein ORF2/G2P domain-containing protein n=1 Tax=Pseudolysinimonas kribbensis TaxID=433641 RepID=A0ABQ6KFE2_9MICO|nr:hypothetical protein GCM10025881_40190 [Pseudolysinimonas kribbensis]